MSFIFRDDSRMEKEGLVACDLKEDHAKMCVTTVQLYLDYKKDGKRILAPFEQHKALQTKESEILLSKWSPMNKEKVDAIVDKAKEGR